MLDLILYNWKRIEMVLPEQFVLIIFDLCNIWLDKQLQSKRWQKAYQGQIYFARLFNAYATLVDKWDDLDIWDNDFRLVFKRTAQIIMWCVAWKS